MDNKKSVFRTLSTINVNEHTETKQNLTYLSWAWAWQVVQENYPKATYEIIKNEDGLPYFADLNGAMCYTKITIEDVTHEMWLPVMDNANKAMKDAPYTYKTRNGEKTVEAYSMFDINKTLMRCLVKNLAMFGLGLYIYAGEDLPELPKDEPLSPEQAKEIHALIKTAKELDMKAFLEFAQADSVENILSSLFPKLKKMLQAKQPKKDAK